MDKIAIVVQRYSLDVNGGAELHARLLAEHLKDRYEVHILTTCAKDYITWANYYPEGKEIINAINVHRFRAEEINKKDFIKPSRYLHSNIKYSRRKIKLSNFFILPFKRLQYRKRKNHNEIFEAWIQQQGPQCRGLIKHLETNANKYTAFIFFTYLYYPTYVGLQTKGISSKSILVPTAHDEIPFYFEGYNKMFSKPQFIMYNTISEKELVENTYPQCNSIKSDIAGVGFDKPLLNDFYKEEPQCRYLVYIGRIDKNKGCKELVNYFIYYKKTHQNDVKLIMIGNNFMNRIEHSDDIIYTGFIDEQEKLWYLKNSLGLVIPSKFESLSMVTLEAMIMGKPVIATRYCEVLKKHIESSQAGFLYDDKENFSKQINKLTRLSEEEKIVISENGKAYVSKNYQWSTIIDKFVDAINYIRKDNNSL